MEQFTTRHKENIRGVLHGFDRVIFRGTVRSISYPGGLGKYLNSQGILLKDFDSWAKRCTQRLCQHIEALARTAGRPYVYLPSSATSKEEQARTIASRDHIDSGLVCVLSCVEPCVSADIHRNRETRQLELVFRQRKCMFYYLYLIHPSFGWMHVRIQSWIPFEVQVYVNGRTYLQRAMDKAGIGYVQDGNCFTAVDDLEKAQGLMDALVEMKWSTIFQNLLREYWPTTQTGLLPDGPERFYWTLRQSEVASDVMFTDAAALAAVYPRLCRHAIEGLSCQDILRFMGKRSSRPGGEVTSSYQRLVLGVRIKHQVDTNTIKMYDKAGSVLRIETTVNRPDKLQVYRGPLDRPDEDVKWRAMSKSVADIRRRVEVCRATNRRYLDALALVGQDLPTAAVLDPVTKPVVQSGERERGLRPINPDEAALFAAVMDAKNLLPGLSNGSLQAAMFAKPPRDASQSRQRSNWIGRKLRLLRRHGLIRKLGSRRLYRVTFKGEEVMGLALALRQSRNIMSPAA